MTDFKRLTAEECADLLLSVKEPCILMHTKPDGDAVGSAMALFTIYKMLGRRAKLLCCDPIADRLRFILRGEELSEYENGMSVVSIDVASKAQMGTLSDKIEAPVIMIDHHATGTPFAPYYTVADAASASEALLDVIDVLIKRGLITMTRELAYPLYAAICSDTGCFAFSNTRSLTHIRVAALIDTGIDFADINRRLFGQKSLLQTKAEALTADRIALAEGGKIAYATIPRRIREEKGIPFEHFETAIDVARAIEGVEIAFVVKESDRGDIKASIRSLGANVADVASKFGGGGHIRAAGCTLAVKNAEEGAELILEALKPLLG